ncbi:MAG: aminotransferase class III-fold pyridoxal phosphate-dependent enzyme, partial [Parachlamydia sp.]|nr:aminotransferase class III-fold pyridoxal phosphate-dependent enzyme [Parachlamydia sp.]
MDEFATLAKVQLMKDPRLHQAKKLINEALQEHGSKISGVKPPDPALHQSYKELLDSFGLLRAGSLYFPYLSSGLGNGCLVELLDGSVKYDMICGIGPHYFGHSDPDLISTGIEAALNDTVMQGHLQQGIEPYRFSSLLTKAAGLDHCFLSTSGAMANENALKIAFQKKFPAHRVLAFEHCFMGRTLALSQITDKPAYRQGLPSSLAVDYIPFYQACDPEKSTHAALEALKMHLHRYPKQHAVMCFEMVQGEAGSYPGSHEFFKALMELLKEQDI